MVVPSIHHVQIAMPKDGEEEARRFYAEILGLIEQEKPDSLKAHGGVWFRSDNLELHLGVDSAFAPATKAHTAFQVSDIDQIRERVARASFAIVEDDLLPGYRRFYTNDPFGNRVEILEPAADSSSAIT